MNGLINPVRNRAGELATAMRGAAEGAHRAASDGLRGKLRAPGIDTTELDRARQRVDGRLRSLREMNQRGIRIPVTMDRKHRQTDETNRSMDRLARAMEGGRKVNLHITADKNAKDSEVNVQQLYGVMKGFMDKEVRGGH